jgi:hypothetical protein
MAAPQPSNAHDPRVSGLLLQHAQAMKAGDFPRAFLALQQIVEIGGSAKGAFPSLGPPEIFARLEPLQYIIEAIDLCPGAPAMWAGYGYSGKTIAAQAAALSIAADIGKVWDCFTAPRGRVLHLDYEQGSRLTRERYQRLAYPMMIGPSDLGDRLSLVTMPTRYLDQAAAESDLERLVAGFSLVIIDSLKASAPSIDENSSDARRVLDMLSRVSERSGATFVVIHHARKPNATQMGGTKMAIRGSGALFDACGSVLVFEAEKGEPVRVTQEKARSRGILAEDFTLEISDLPDGMNPRAGLIVSGAAAPSREKKAEDQAKERRRARTARLASELRDLFRATPEQFGADSIATKLGRKASDVRSALAVLVEGGEVTAVGKSRDRRHQWAGRE